MTRLVEDCCSVAKLDVIIPGVRIKQALDLGNASVNPAKYVF